MGVSFAERQTWEPKRWVKPNGQWLTYWACCSVPTFFVVIIPRRFSTGVMAAIGAYVFLVLMVELVRREQAPNEVTLDGDAFRAIAHGEETLVPAEEVRKVELLPRGVRIAFKATRPVFVPGLDQEQAEEIGRALQLSPTGPLPGPESPRSALIREGVATVAESLGVRLAPGLPTSAALLVDEARGRRGFSRLEIAGWVLCVGCVLLVGGIAFAKQGAIDLDRLPSASVAAGIAALLIGTVTGVFQPARPHRVVVYDDRVCVDYQDRVLEIPAKDITRVTQGPEGVRIATTDRRPLVLPGLAPDFAIQIEAALKGHLGG